MADNKVIPGDKINELVARLCSVMGVLHPPSVQFVLVMSPWTLDALRKSFDEVTLRPIVEFRIQGGFSIQGHHVHLHNDFDNGVIIVDPVNAIINGATPT